VEDVEVGESERAQGVEECRVQLGGVGLGDVVVGVAG
jgi:hypothetical protein